MTRCVQSQRDTFPIRIAGPGPVDWRRGLVLPDTADHMDYYNEGQERGLYGGSPPWKPKDLSTAIVYHGERPHALQVNHEKTIVGEPYLWSIHAYHGPGGADPATSHGWEHLDPGDRDLECGMCGAEPGKQCDPDCWDQISHTGGPLGTTLEDERFQDGSRGELWGYQPDRESAQRAAETAWGRHTQRQGSGLGEMDINQIMRDEGFR